MPDDKDKKPKSVSDTDTLRKRAKIVKEAPTGPEWEKLTSNGEEIYVKRAKGTEPDSTGGKIEKKPVDINKVKTKYVGSPPKDKPKKDTEKRKTPPAKTDEDEVVKVIKDEEEPLVPTTPTPTTPIPTTSTPKPKQTGLYGSVWTNERIDPAKQWGADYGITTIETPDAEGRFTNTSRKFNLDKEGNEIVYDEANPLNNFKDGKFIPTYTGRTIDDIRKEYEIQQIETPSMSGVNRANPDYKGSLMMPGTKATRIIGGGSGELNQRNIGNTPNALNKAPVGYIEQKYDAQGNPIATPNTGVQMNTKKLEPLRKGEMEVGKMYDVPSNEPVTIPGKFAKGGSVKAPKVIKKYAGGTGVDGLTDQQRNAQYGVTSQGSIQPGTVQIGGGQGQYGTTGNATTATGATSAQEGSDKKQKKEKTQEQLNKEAKLRSGIGSALGGYGTSYLASAPDTGSQDSATKEAMGTVSGLGAVGGAVSGVYGIIDKPARDEKNKAEQIEVTYDANGKPVAKLKSEARAKDTAIAGSFLSPSEAISTRSSYEGGWTDVSGKGYTKYLEKKAQEQLDEKLKEEATYKQNQAVANREAGNLEGSVSNLYNFRGASYGDDKKLNIQYAAKGGTIVGKGGPKDDAIFTKSNEKGIPAGSFIVPAENNEKAKGIRAALFGNKNKKAEFKKGGETESNVAVSNGEHLFTPKERKKIINYLGEEILEELAPNAEENNEEKEMNMGGMLGNMTDRTNMREYLKGGLMKRADGSYSKRGLWDNIRDAAGSNKAPTPEMLKQEKKIKAEYYNGGMIPESIASQKRTEEIQDTYASGGYVVESSSDRKGKTHKVTGPDGTVKYFGDSNLGQHPKDPERKKAFYARHEENLKNNPYFRAYARETWAEGGTTGDGLSKEKAKTMLHEGVANGKPITEQQRKYFGWVAGGSKESKMDGGKIMAPKMMYANGTPKKGSSKTPKSLYFETKMADESEGENVIVPGDNLSPNERAALVSKEKTDRENAKKLNESAMAYQAANAPKTPPPTKKKGLADYIGNIDPTAIGAAMQVMEGKKLIQSGKRPTDVSKIDPAWNAAVERAQREAAFGYTPEQRVMLEQQRINALNDARFAGRNLAGGSASTAYQQERQAINEGWANALQLKSADQQLRMQKQQYADQAVRDRASFLDMQRRRAYGDAMDTYNINQESGAALVGAGVRNAIGAYRYQKELEAQEKAAKVAGAPVYNG